MINSPIPPDPSTWAEVDTESLKQQVLELVQFADEVPMAQKVRFANDTLLPLFQELEKRNPNPDLIQQISLVQGVWSSVWSTIPFQDILPGRMRSQSYQIFANNGYYANLARYNPGHKTPILNQALQGLISYDLMILQTYKIKEEEIAGDDTDSELRTQQWDIQNVGIKQRLRLGAISFSPEVAQNWFSQVIANDQDLSTLQDRAPNLTQYVSRDAEKRYQKVMKAQPKLEHLYIDPDFRLVKTRREQNQRPSYTVATRIKE